MLCCHQGSGGKAEAVGGAGAAAAAEHSAAAQTSSARCHRALPEGPPACLPEAATMSVMQLVPRACTTVSTLLLILSNGRFCIVLQLLERMSPPWRRHSVKSKPDVSLTTAGESSRKTLRIFLLVLLLLFGLLTSLLHVSFVDSMFIVLFTNYGFYSLFPLKVSERLLRNFPTKRSVLWRPIQNCFRSRAPPVSRAASKLRGLRTITAHRCVACVDVGGGLPRQRQSNQHDILVSQMQTEQ